MNLLDLARSALSKAPATVYDAPIREWCVTYPSGTTMTVLFHPPTTRVGVAASYLGASLEPLPNTPKRLATPAETTELRALIAGVLRDAPAEEQAEALAVARADPDAALECFRALARAAADRP